MNTTATTTTTDIRIASWSFGRRCQTLGMAYRQLEASNPEAVRVFTALRQCEWGVEAAFHDGLRGVNIEGTDRRTGVQVAYTGGAPYAEPFVRRTRVAANGGTI